MLKLFCPAHVASATQAENERSFKLLQEYLGKAKSTAGDARSPSATQAFREYRWVSMSGARLLSVSDMLLQEYLGKAKSTVGDARSPSATQFFREYRWVNLCMLVEFF